MPSIRQALAGLTVLLIVFLTACSSGGGAQTGVPSGWQSANGHWWQQGVDTSNVFRDLETLQAMGITEEPQIASLEGITQDQFIRAVKEELAPLYRHRPALIDSLFQEYAQEDLEGVSLGEEPDKTVTKYKNVAYKTLSDHFKEPRASKTLGKDVPIVYPDSLRREETSGRIVMQVYLNGEGAPQAVQLLEGVHPTLNDLAMNAATRMRWEPAYLMQDGEWVGVPAWVEFTVNFQLPGA